MPSNDSFAGVRAIYFDVDDTLYDFAESMRHAFAHLRVSYHEMLGHHDVERLAEAYWRHYHSYPEHAKVELINRDPDLFRRTMWAGALANLGLDEDERAKAWLRAAHPTVQQPFADPEGFARVITAEFQRLRPDHWRAAMYPGAREALLELKARFTLGAITNGPSAVQRPKLVALQYPDFFDEHRVFVSGEFGTRKPDPTIFLAAAQAAGVDPRECLMVGDALEFDMPAKAVGFRTVLFDGKKKAPDVSREAYPPDAVVTSYSELLALLE